MRPALLALAAGLVLLRFLPSLPPGWILALLAVVSPAFLLSRAFALSFFLLGFTWACFSAQNALDDRLAPALDGRTLWVTGSVVGLPEQTADGVRFELANARSRRAELPSLLRLSWRGGPDLKAGEHLRVAVTLRAPHGLVNPVGFDYEAWSLARRIGATGTVKAGEQVAAPGGLNGLRDSIRQALFEQDAYGREGALAALIVGDGSGLSSADWTLLQATGTIHLMVISGQHITMVAGLVYGLIFGMARLGLWPRQWPWIPCACIAAFLAALTYGLMAGFQVPVRRACVMVAFVLLWRWRFRQLGIVLPLLVALNVVLLAEPLAVLQPGFWLSFGAVSILALAFVGRLGAPGMLATAWRAQWTVTVGLLPFLLILGLPVSLSSPVANLIAVPWVGVGIVPIALLGCLLLPIPWVGSSLLWLAGFLLELLFRILAVIADAIPVWLPVHVPWWGWLLGGLGAFCLLLPAGTPGRLLGGILLLPLFFAPAEEVSEGQAHVWVFDVGQGQAVLIRTRDHALVYDAGPRFGDFDLGARVVLPNVRALGVHRLDQLLLSHADADHAGGALALHSTMPILRVSSGEAEALPSVLNAQSCGGESWRWNGVTFATWRSPAPTDSNASSCVLRVEANGESLLLTGDVDMATEKRLIESGWNLPSRWLQAAHHGSKTGTGDPFLDAVGPAVALISRGKHNGYGHPHPDVIGRLNARGVEVLDTAATGAIHIQLGTHGKAILARREHVVFWR